VLPKLTQPVRKRASLDELLNLREVLDSAVSLSEEGHM